MSEATTPVNGDFKLNGNSLGALLVIINLVALIGGFGVLWGVQSSRLDDLRARHEAFVASSQAQEANILTRLDRTEKAMNDDRLLLNTRLTALEGDIKYISQMLQELRLTFKKP